MLTIWAGALVFGFLGGTLGQRLIGHPTTSPELTSASRARRFELVDPSGRIVSIWTMDSAGRPYLAMNDRRWEGRVVIGPIEGFDVVGNEPPPENLAAWGIRVTAPGHAALAAVGTSIQPGAKQPSGFIVLQNEHRVWRRNVARETSGN